MAHADAYSELVTVYREKCRDDLALDAIGERSHPVDGRLESVSRFEPFLLSRGLAVFGGTVQELFPPRSKFS